MRSSSNQTFVCSILGSGTSFAEIGRGVISTTLLSLPLIQVGQLSTVAAKKLEDVHQVLVTGKSFMPRN